MKLLARLLPELYSTHSSYYYFSSQQRQPAYHNFKWSLNSQYLAIIGEFDWHNMPTRRYTDMEQKQQWNHLEFQGKDREFIFNLQEYIKESPIFFNLHSPIPYRHISCCRLSPLKNVVEPEMCPAEWNDSQKYVSIHRLNHLST